jgi:hypothetical protein
MNYVKKTLTYLTPLTAVLKLHLYYPNAHDVITKTARQFKLRESEKTPASLKLLENGVWVVTDFGGDAILGNGVQVCAGRKKTKSYGEVYCLAPGLVKGVNCKFG